MKRVLVTGANGQLGQEFRYWAGEQSGFIFYFVGKSELDIREKAAISDRIGSLNPDVIINCAAYTKVDQAEEDAEMCREINVEGAKNLAIAAQENDACLIHYSSDYVYHNTVRRPIKEDDPCTPQGVYAKTKLEGEKEVMEVGGCYFVFRTSWVYSSFGHNFVKTMQRLFNQLPFISIVHDQIGAPCYARDIARSTLDLIRNDQNFLQDNSGVYNLSNSGKCSWFEFALAIQEELGTECQINSIPSVDYPTAAKRPEWSVMNNDKVIQDLDLVMPEWRDGLKRCIQALKD